MAKQQSEFSMNGKPRQDCRGQSSFYDKLLVLDPLTDRKIEEYERQGKYGPERQSAALQRLKDKKVTKTTRRKTVDISDLI